MNHKGILEQACQLPALTLVALNIFKVITALCNNRQLRELILKCKFHNNHIYSKLLSRSEPEWEAVKTMANELVSQLCLPVSVNKRVLEQLWPMAYRMMLWKSVYAPHINNSCLQRFHWTERGRINNTKTSRSILGNKNIPARKRFVLACSVCLKEEINEIYGELSDDDKSHLYADRMASIYPLVRYWLHAIEGSFYDTTPHFHNAWVCASKIGLLEAVKYLFAKAPENEKTYMRDECIDELINKLRSGNLLEEDEHDIECFLLSQMTAGEREDTFNSNFETALSLLLHSSKFELSLKLLEEKLERASEYDVITALEMIFYTYHLEVINDEGCRKLFMDAWKRIPTRMRNTQILNDLSAEFLSVLIRDNFPIVFKKGAFKIIKVPNSDFKNKMLNNQPSFYLQKLDLLIFVIKEAVRIPALKKRKKKIMAYLKNRESNKVWKRVMIFVKQIRKQRIQAKIGAV